MTKGFVYFAGYKGVVKIGMSINPEQRVQALSTSNPEEVVPYVYIPTEDMEALEARLHRYFTDARIRGEWYEVTSEIRYLITTLQATKKFMEFDIGVILGQYTAAKAMAALDKNYQDTNKIKWREAMADRIQRKLWSLEYTIRSLGLSDFAMFRDRLTEVTAIVDALAAGEVPMLIRDKDGRLTNGVEKSDNSNTEAA